MCDFTMSGIKEFRAVATFNLKQPPRPNTVLLSKPPKSTKSKSATFYWGAKTGTNPVKNPSKSQCKFDKARSWTTCRPGKTYKKLKPGTHTFRVRVGNANGWDATPAVYSWKVRK